MAKGHGLVQELLSSHYSVDDNSPEHSETGSVRIPNRRVLACDVSWNRCCIPD
jgi:hypothetical protein